MVSYSLNSKVVYIHITLEFIRQLHTLLLNFFWPLPYKIYLTIIITTNFDWVQRPSTIACVFIIPVALRQFITAGTISLKHYTW